MISWPIINRFQQNFQQLVTYLADIHYTIFLKICYPILGQPDHTIFQIFQNPWYLWPLIMDIYKIFRKYSTNYVKKIRQKKSNMLYPLGATPPPYHKTLDISANYGLISTKFSAIGHLISWYVLDKKQFEICYPILGQPRMG